MLFQAVEVAFDSLANIFGCFGARSALGHTAGKRRASGNEYPVLILLQINAIPHYPAFYQSGAKINARSRSPSGPMGNSAIRYNRFVMDVYEELVRLRRMGQKCALATIVEVKGSIPSYESAKLLVREDGSMTGTIGGGCVEAEVWNAAREVIETEKPRRLAFNLGQDAAYDNGLICGGQLEVFVEPVLPVPYAYIFGAGHISKSLSKVAALASNRR